MEFYKYFDQLILIEFPSISKYSPQHSKSQPNQQKIIYRHILFPSIMFPLHSTNENRLDYCLLS